MLKKPIKTKLSKTATPETKEKKEPVKASPLADNKLYPKSYKLTAADVRRLDEIVRDVNAVSTFKVKEINVIKGMIFLASKMKNKERIAKAYKDSL